jgi:hypothetical protein
MTRIQHTQNHPHGHIWCNEDDTIEFLRVSKNGSTSFTKSLQLNIVKNFSESNQSALKFACIRNPHKRFISSIPETIKRIALCQVHADDVVVSKTIYNNLQFGKLQNAQDILYLFINTIEDFGFFDAHHEPQIHFFLKNNGSIGFDPLCFDLENMNSVIESLGGERLQQNSRSSSQRNKQPETLKAKLQFALGLTGMYKTNRHYMPISKDSIQYKFLTDFGGNFNHFRNHRIQLNRFLIDLYKELQQYINDLKLLHFIESQYQTDINLYNKLSGDPLKQFTTIYHPK